MVLERISGGNSSVKEVRAVFKVMTWHANGMDENKVRNPLLLNV